MGALENAKNMSSEAVLEKIAALGLKQYGIKKELLSKVLSDAVLESQEEEKELGVVAALNNADTDGVLLEVLKEDPEKVMEGIAIVAYAIGAEKKALNIPTYASELMDTLKETAEKYQVELVEDIVNVRANKGCALVHIVAAANLADAFNDSYTEGVYVAVNGEALKKVAPETKLSELASMEGAKAILVGYKYHTPEDADMTVADAEVDNGIISVLTDKDCVVAVSEAKLLASRKQSCGKCVFCREGLLQLQYMQKEITEGRGKLEYLELTKEIGEAMTYSTPCTMGQVSSEIALTATENFVSDYEAHIKKKKCPVCFSTEVVYIDPKTCTGCEECVDVCPKDCIEGKAKYIHMIDEFDCDKCGKCIEVCEEGAIIKTSGKVPKLPNRLTKVGRFKKR